MAYADLLDDEGVNNQYLVVIKPRRIITGSWSLVSGTIYKISYSLGQVIAALDDGTALTEASSSSVSSNEWFYDTATEELYVDVGADPASSQIVVTYEIYLSTFDAHINRVPTDSSTRVVYFEPLITRAPNIVSSTKEVIFGFLPTFSGSLSVSNVTSFLQEHLYASSFSNADFDLYHWLGDLENANIKLVLRGLCIGAQGSDNEVTFRLLDSSEEFNQEYRNQVGNNFFSSSDFSGLNPDFEGRAIRQVYGVVEGFVPVNIDFEIDSPTTSDNRDWVVLADETNLGTKTTTVSSSPSSTTTRTYIANTDGFRVGDQIENTTASEYAVVTAVNKIGSQYVDHTTWTAATSADTITRPFIGKINILRQGELYEPLYGRDWTILTDATNKVAGFSFETTMESNLSITGALQPSDVVFCRVYGHTNQTTLGGGSFGFNSVEAGVLADPVVILFQLLKDLGLEEAVLNTSSFSSLRISITDEVGFAVPEKARQDFPSYKNLILQIAQTILLKIFLDNDLKWKISQLGPVGSADKDLEDDEILLNSFTYKFSYDDIISLAIVEYAQREISQNGSSQGASSKVQASSTVAKNLHNVEKQKTFKSLHYSSSDASDLASRIRYALGDRRGVATLRAKNRLFDTLLDTVVDVSRDRMPGFSYTQDTLRERSFQVVKTSKSLTEITLELDDQKGIEDNSGDW